MDGETHSAITGKALHANGTKRCMQMEHSFSEQVIPRPTAFSGPPEICCRCSFCADFPHHACEVANLGLVAEVDDRKIDDIANPDTSD